MINSGTRRLDRLFDFALLILTVLSASELQVICSIPERQAGIPYAFRILTYPILTLMVFWLLREVAFRFWLGHSTFKMAFREFFWGFLACTLCVYLIIYLELAFESVNLISVIFFGILSVSLAVIVSIGYGKAEPGMVYFRRRRRRIVRSALIFGLAYASITFMILTP